MKVLRLARLTLCEPAAVGRAWVYAGAAARVDGAWAARLAVGGRAAVSCAGGAVRASWGSPGGAAWGTLDCRWPAAGAHLEVPFLLSLRARVFVIHGCKVIVQENDPRRLSRLGVQLMHVCNEFLR